jgi:aerobic-type carbon monoxide dehydrogenase small subunit (CoxS/CutS family)
MLTVTINGRAYGPREVRDELSMNDFLQFGCGAARCLSCVVIVDNSDGTSHTMPTCVVPAVNFNGKTHGRRPCEKRRAFCSAKSFHRAFRVSVWILHPGFLNEGQVLLERLAKKPVARADLEKTIAEALNGHLCRCTGYIKYYEAVRDVILADSGRYLSRT